MTLSRSILLGSPQPKTTRNTLYNYGWCKYTVDGSNICNWGTVEQKDPGNLGYDQPYRTDGQDVSQLIIARPYGPITRDPDCKEGENVHWPFCEGVTIDIFVNKGALPHHKLGEFQELSGIMGYDFVKDILCEVYLDGGFAYYLYQDKSLPGVCNPGGYFMIRTQPVLQTENTIYKPKESYSIDDMKVDTPVVSGTTSLKFKPYWQVTGSGIGFYKDTGWMKVGGYLTLGPNTDGDISICQITNLKSSTEVDVTEILYPFNTDDPIYYWTSDIQPTHYLPVSEGLVKDPGPAATGGPKTGQLNIEMKGGLDTYTTVESFIPIPWAIPAPYSIRNVPHTSIWLRLDDPAVPFNTNTLDFKVNKEDVTESVQVTRVTGGVELFYDPPVNFDLASRVYVDIGISCSPSIYTNLARNATEGAQYLTVSGDLNVFQAGGLLRIGPNELGQLETATVQFLEGASQIKIVDPLDYSYSMGAMVIYTYDDYPIKINYYFDIVDDFRPPTFENFYPCDGMENVNRFQWIMFDIKDEGLGVDISTLSFTVDNMVVIPQVYKYSDHWYRVIYSPPVPYYYNARVNCFATVMDKSSRKNRAFTTWSFNTEMGETPIIVNPKPFFCAYPVHHKSHVGVDVFAQDAGANLHSMIFTWDQKEYKVITYPKIYRRS